MLERDIVVIVEVLDPKGLFGLVNGDFGRGGGLHLLVDGVVDIFAKAPHQAGEPMVQIGGVIALAADNERGARLVDEDAVHLVDDGVV